MAGSARDRAWPARLCLLAVLASPGIVSPHALQAQGCTACRDATAGSAPAARRGLRKAIAVLGVPAGAIFVCALWVAYRIERQRED